MKPAWDELGDEYIKSKTVIIGDVDCTTVRIARCGVFARKAGSTAPENHFLTRRAYRIKTHSSVRSTGLMGILRSNTSLARQPRMGALPNLTVGTTHSINSWPMS